MTETISTLENKIKTFEEQQKQAKKHNTSKSKTNISIIYNIIAELAGGVITAFILNKIYVNFFGKNKLVFALLLLLCSMAGLYNVIKILLKGK